MQGLELAELARGNGEEREREVVGVGSGGERGGEGGGDVGAEIRVILGFWRGFGSDGENGCLKLEIVGEWECCSLVCTVTSRILGFSDPFDLWLANG